MIAFFLISLVVLMLATGAWMWLRSRRAKGPYKFVPPERPGSPEDARYNGEVLPRQRELVLAAYRYLTGEVAPDTIPFGFRELRDGQVYSYTPDQLGPVLPLPRSLCDGAKNKGWDRLLESSMDEILLMLPPEHKSSARERLKQLPEDHRKAYLAASKDPVSAETCWGLGAIPSNKPALKTYRRLSERNNAR